MIKRQVEIMNYAYNHLNEVLIELGNSESSIKYISSYNKLNEIVCDLKYLITEMEEGINKERKTISYINALKEGIAAAEKAKLAKKKADIILAETKAINFAQIDAVFDEFGKEILKGSNGKISVSRRSDCLLVYNPTIFGSPLKELANLNTALVGFPCRIKWGDIEYICEDKEAIENTLVELLRDPVIGRLLLYVSMESDSASIENDS